MKRYIVLSVNDDPEYLQYVPLAIWAWEKIGWSPILIFCGDEQKTIVNTVIDCVMIARGKDTFRWLNVTPYIKKSRHSHYRTETITQVSRLYPACNNFFSDDDLMMSGDIDLIPLSDYWQPNPREITIYGNDLAENHYPICYIAMSAKNWRNVMNIDGSNIETLIKRDLDKMPQAKDTDFYKYWFTDQDLITDQLKGHPVKLIPRGKIHNGLAQGRVDRGDWSMMHNGNFIDAHLHRDLYKAFQNPEHEHFKLYQKKWAQHTDLLATVWPNEDWAWFIDFTKQFAELAK